MWQEVPQRHNTAGARHCQLPSAADIPLS
jgi:hypothetical protein